MLESAAFIQGLIEGEGAKLQSAFGDELDRTGAGRLAIAEAIRDQLIFATFVESDVSGAIGVRLGV
jgi:hypothetical protein